MKCEICGQNKSEYDFFKHRNKYDAEFFLNLVPKVDTCWTCAGPYRCIICHEIKVADQFRVGGRVCIGCRIPTQNRVTRSKERRMG